MAIHQTGKSSDLEKRLKLLRSQIYGKDLVKSALVKISHNPLSSSKTEILSDSSFLNQDLIKISFLSILAIGTQLVLFYLSKKNIINLNLF